MTKEKEIILRKAISECPLTKVISTLDVFNMLFSSCLRKDYLIDDLSFKDFYEIVFDDYIARGVDVF